MKTRIPESVNCIDIHNHVSAGADGRLDRARAEALLDGCARLGIQRLCVSRPLTHEQPTPDEVRQANDTVLEAMAFNDRFIGFCFLNPGTAREAVAEMDRCIRQGGMRGVKLYHQYLICDPAQTAVMEAAADMGVPVLMHAGKVMDSTTRRLQPRLSHAGHFVQACRMFPRTTLIQGHIGGGGDWEWNLRELEARPGSYLDISGSVVDAGIVARTVATLGADHVLFATDGVLEEGVGKLLAAGLSDADLAKVCQHNAERILGLRRA
ncbi:MAG: amidohydrolase family protein [Lentisphaerae bacterium]|nr:amidohydrolase family protein [Lentisphaerota bacterium]